MVPPSTFHALPTAEQRAATGHAYAARHAALEAVRTARRERRAARRSGGTTWLPGLLRVRLLRVRLLRVRLLRVRLLRPRSPLPEVVSHPPAPAPVLHPAPVGDCGSAG